MKLDVVIFGGGAAGLWLLDALVERHYRVVLLEAGELGASQTVCAQGIIHGGLKYTLDGVLTPAAESIREMPDLWRDCLAGRRAPRLTATRVRSDECWLWRTSGVRSRVGMIGARLGLQTRPQSVARDDRPEVLAGCPGSVARISEPVIDPVSFLADLAGQHRERILRIDAAAGLTIHAGGAGNVTSIDLVAPGASTTLTLRASTVVFTAGAGNADLAAAAGVEGIAMQQTRPLHMVMVRGALPQLNGHCVDGAHTRVTVTADTDGAGRTVWQLGGQIAEDGVTMERAALLEHAALELQTVLPGVNLEGAQWASYRVDRAEAATAGGRPSDISLVADGNVIVGWPTKLALAPRLAAAVIEKIEPPAGDVPAPPPADWPRPVVARPPWEWDLTWTEDV